MLGTLGCIAIALYVDSLDFMTLDQAGRNRAILTNISSPLMLAAPMLLFLASKLRELAIAHHELSIVASRDGLTSVLNRGAFTTLLDAYLSQVRDQHYAAKHSGRNHISVSPVARYDIVPMAAA